MSQLQAQIQGISTLIQNQNIDLLMGVNEKYPSLFAGINLDKFDFDSISEDWNIQDNIIDSDVNLDTTSTINFLMLCVSWLVREIPLTKEQRAPIIIGIIFFILTSYSDADKSEIAQKQLGNEQTQLRIEEKQLEIQEKLLLLLQIDSEQKSKCDKNSYDGNVQNNESDNQQNNPNSPINDTPRI